MRLVLAWKASLTVLLLACFVTLGDASSSKPLPLKRLGHLSDVRLDVLSRSSNDDSERLSSTQRRDLLKPSSWLRRTSPRQVLYNDKIRLSFRAFAQDFHLHLEPTKHLIHPDGAQIRHTSLDKESGALVTREEMIYQHEIRAFRGVVIHPEHTTRRMAEDVVGVKRGLGESSADGVMGRAAIMLHDDGAETGQYSFEGTFTWLGNDHNIQMPSSYHASRQEADPLISKRALERNSPIIHRRSDIMTPKEAQAIGIRAPSDESGCSADDHEYNLENPLFQTDYNNVPSSLSPFSFFASPPASRQLTARSLFPWLRGEASKESALVDRTFSYEVTDLARRQNGDDLRGPNANASYTNSIGSTAGCPSTLRAVYMGIASDCTYTGRFSNSSAASMALLNNMNTVSNIYRSTFMVALGVVRLEVRDASTCGTTSNNEAWNADCNGGLALDQRLSAFSQWRGTQPANGTGLWHLLTTCNNGNEVGVGWLGTLCMTRAVGQGSDTISGTSVSAATSQTSQVMAHEIGHNFGAIHDCVGGCSISGTTARQTGGALCCPQSTGSCNSNSAYIMSPVSRTDTDVFSPCSIGNVCTLLSSSGGLDTSCVVDPSQDGRTTLSIQQCGNGILEPGEECDSGPNGSRCCSSTCRLTSGSVCDPATSACCNDSCQFASAGTVCRPAVDGRCDTQEVCSGNNATCPVDVRSADGSSCGNGLSCASGHCTSRSLQCQQQSYQGLNFTSACSTATDGGCSISCQNPQNPLSCLQLQQTFIDGTTCGNGGTCQAGQCRAGSWQDTFRGWYRDHLNIAIPVTIVIAVIAIAILYGIFRCLCLRSRRSGPAAKMAANGGTPPMRQSGAAYPSYSQANNGYAPPLQQPPPSLQQQQVPPPPRRSNWVDPQSYNGR